MLATACALLLGAAAFGTVLEAQEPAPTAQSAETATVADAVRELESQLQKEPGNPKLHLLLGLAHMRNDDGERAVEAFRRAVDLAPESAEAHNWLGVALSDRADLPGAIAALRKAVALDPKHGRAFTNLGAALVKAGDFGEAAAVFEQALALEPNSLAAHMNLGMALREKGDAEQALHHLRLVAEKDPTNAGVHYELGQALRQAGDLQGATAAFEKSLELDPELREGYYGLGQALKQQAASARVAAAAAAPASDDRFTRARDAAARGDLSAARDELAAILAADPEHAEAHSLMGFVLGQQGQLPAALPHLERAVALRPQSADARYNLGAALWYSGARERAVAQFRESVSLDPASGTSHAFLGTALRERGDLAGARASLQRAIALLPPSAAVLIDLGITYLLAGDLPKAIGPLVAGLNVPTPAAPAPDYAAAIARLRKALDASPENAEAHNVLGLLLGRTGADGAAVAAAFREAIRLRPDYAEAHNNLGLVLLQTGDDPGGIAALREAVRLAPQYAEARANLGAALTLTNVDESIRELEKAVELAPGSVKAHFNLAVAYGASPPHGSVKEIEQLRKVIALAPAFHRAHLALGKALLQAGQIPEAVTALQEAARLDPQSGEANYQLGLALARAGRKDEAAAALKRGRELVAVEDRDQNANLDISEGRSALEQGELEQAAARLRRAAQLRPDSAEAQRLLGTVLEKQGQAADARAAYTKALELNPGDAAARAGLERLARTGAAATPAAAAPASPSPAHASAAEPPPASSEAGARRADHLRQGSGGPPEPEAKAEALRHVPAPLPPPRPATEAKAAGLSAEDDPQRVAEFEGYIRDSRFADVEPQLAEYVKARPKSSWGWYALGYTQFAQQKIGDSIRSLAKSLQLDITNAEAHKILGRNLMIIGRYDAAQLEFEQAIRYKPGSAELHYNLGKLHSIQDNWGPARTALETAVHADPSYVEAVDALGFALEALGEDANAVATYQKAIELNQARGGTFSNAHVNLAAYYNRTGDAARALEYAKQALAIDPKSDRALFQKARADEHDGRLDEAVDALNRAIAINPRVSSYYYVLAGVYRRMGWQDESDKALEQFKRLDQESQELEKKRRSTARAMPPAGDPRRE